VAITPTPRPMLPAAVAFARWVDVLRYLPAVITLSYVFVFRSGSVASRTKAVIVQSWGFA